MELAVGLLKGFGHSFYRGYNLQTTEKLHIHAAGVADEAEDRHFGTLGDMHIQVHVLEPADQVGSLFLSCSVFQYCDHVSIS